MKYLTGTTAIEAAITSIQNRGKKLDADIQKVALSVIHHHHQHGDVSLINRLVEAMPKGSRVNALREFIEYYGGVSYDTETKAFVHDKEKKAAAYYAEAIAAGEMQLWTEFKPEAEYKPMDFPAQLAKLLKTAAERAGSGKGDKVPADLLKKVQAIMEPEVAF